MEYYYTELSPGHCIFNKQWQRKGRACSSLHNLMSELAYLRLANQRKKKKNVEAFFLCRYVVLWGSRISQLLMKHIYSFSIPAHTISTTAAFNEKTKSDVMWSTVSSCFVLCTGIRRHALPHPAVPRQVHNRMITFQLCTAVHWMNSW
jgi:hypothetical protein